jgi:hypothetical protein
MMMKAYKNQPTTILLLLVVVACFLFDTTKQHAADAFIIDSLRSRAKADLLELVRNGAPNEQILRQVANVERLSLGEANLSNPLLPGNWLMVWTTSDSIAGKNRKPAFLQTQTPPEQLIDIENQKAVNAEYVLGIRNSVQAEITPATKNKVNVKFKKFQVGPISFSAPEDRFKGELSVSYLDDDMRISRGDLGNAFILLRESNSRQEANELWKAWQKSWK